MLRALWSGACGFARLYAWCVSSFLKNIIKLEIPRFERLDLAIFWCIVSAFSLIFFLSLSSSSLLFVKNTTTKNAFTRASDAQKRLPTQRERERERKEKDDDDDSFGGGVFGTVSFERHRSGRERSLVRTLSSFFFPGAAKVFFLDTSPRRRRRDDGEGFTFGRRIRVHVEAREARGVVSVDRGESVERADRDEEEDGRRYDF